MHRGSSNLQKTSTTQQRNQKLKNDIFQYIKVFFGITFHFSTFWSPLANLILILHGKRKYQSTDNNKNRERNRKLLPKNEEI